MSGRSSDGLVGMMRALMLIPYRLTRTAEGRKSACFSAMPILRQRIRAQNRNYGLATALPV